MICSCTLCFQLTTAVLQVREGGMKGEREGREGGMKGEREEGVETRLQS